MLLSSYPQAILHIDADAFFASVEQAIHPELKGKPIVTGAERGIVVAMSYEAKACGVVRGMMGTEAKKRCPGLLFVPSDYETYGLFSKRLFEIMRRFTPQVEEYSIDEAFADITGLRRLHHASYPQIAKIIKETIDAELGITVSVGLSLTKSLAKLASKYKKPSGLVCVPGRQVAAFTKENTIDKVWGFGHNSVALLKKNHIHTVYDFINKPEKFATGLFGKIGTELWQELSGNSLYKVDPSEKTTYMSISKVKTFSPPTNDPDYLYAQLLRNLERATAKMRRFKLTTKRIIIMLKSQQFQNKAFEISLSRSSTSVMEMIEPLRQAFDHLFSKHTIYRSTGIVLCDLKTDKNIQLNIFEDPVRMVKMQHIDSAIDKINNLFGRQAIHLASTIPANHRSQGNKGAPPKRQQNLLTGENKHRRLNMPVLEIRPLH
jgi:DNA polymerase IV